MANKMILIAECELFLNFTPTKYSCGVYWRHFVCLSICLHLVKGKIFQTIKAIISKLHALIEHLWRMQYSRTISLLLYFFELLPFINFHFEFFSATDISLVYALY